jgi:hypothetical protein
MESQQMETIPESMNFRDNGMNAVNATTTLARYDSTNGVSFSPTGANIIRIRMKAPTGGFMHTQMHYLQFQVDVASAVAGGAFVDMNAGSFFERITLSVNGQECEMLDKYALWNGLVSSYQSNLYDVMRLNAEAGGASLTTQSLSADAGADNNKLNAVGLGSLGQTFSNTITSLTFCLPIRSGLLMNTYGKALPDALGELEIAIRLKSSAGALVYASGTPTYTISDPRIFCPTYQIQDDSVMQLYNQSRAAGISIVGDTYQTFTGSLGSVGAGDKTNQINIRVSSLKGLVTVCRDANADNVGATYSNSAFHLTDDGGDVSQFAYVINGQNYPQSEITVNVGDGNGSGANVGRAYEEAVKCLAKHGDGRCESLVSHNNFISAENTYTSVTNTNGLNTAKGVLAVDLRKFDEYRLKNNIGLNTSINGNPSVLRFKTTGTAATIWDLTTFGICEVVWTILPNGSIQVAI